MRSPFLRTESVWRQEMAGSIRSVSGIRRAGGRSLRYPASLTERMSPPTRSSSRRMESGSIAAIRTIRSRSGRQQAPSFPGQSNACALAPLSLEGRGAGGEGRTFQSPPDFDRNFYVLKGDELGGLHTGEGAQLLHDLRGDGIVHEQHHDGPPAGLGPSDVHAGDIDALFAQQRAHPADHAG